MNTHLKRHRALQAMLIAGIAVFALAPAHAEDPAPVAPSATFEKPRLVLQNSLNKN